MDAYLASLVSVIGINMILALSLTIITGFCGQVSLGHAAFYGIGAYTAAYLAKLGMPLPVTLLAGTLMAGAVGGLPRAPPPPRPHRLLPPPPPGAGSPLPALLPQHD